MAAMKIGREGNVTLNYPLLTKSNYSVWALKKRVNLQAQGARDTVELDEVEEARIEWLSLQSIKHFRRTFFSW